MLTGYAFLSPWLIGFFAFTLIPVACSLYYSFCDYTLLQPPVWEGLANYRALASDPVFWQALQATALYGAIALPAGLALAFALALLLNAKVPGLAVYRTLIYLPSLVPAVAAALIWMWMYNPRVGLINLALRAVGVAHPPAWLNDVHWALPALVLLGLWGCGNTVVVFLAGLQDVPAELYEAATLDGAGPLAQVLHVTLPVVAPVIFFNAVLGLIAVTHLFVPAYLMTTGGPNRSTYFYTYYLFDNAFVYLKMGYASAMAWIQLVVVLGLTGVAFGVGRRWIR